ncbi:uncharacterized protein Eint_071640 [Encephalitozoon intestinalis ATCC 50506]|uniref:Cleavage/polyadenylation specificity factor A subunit C-terminal domain-containing protein n=1 Tax=Encephalitozoon intestinalis (strain ATCC 50506) TaxID=876142 RepID=E0S888_ENCIT|nr:uncharacterized protein Eint_071640 [Encephalitozoon intestinalis ATCC 50506]ADM11923.1 hypothetical protein Eint_071640 [Encephalitozoon intestinalis ATCC 50506]UTX45681.1 DNA damage-binding protein 1 [Encephalitozoon intestinalis]
MFYLSRAVVNMDLYMKVLCNSSDIYLVQSSSIAIYTIKHGKLIYVRKTEFFDVIKSAVIIGNELLVVFNGYIVFLDRFLDERTRYRLGRSSVDYRHVGAYIACGKSSICLTSFFGNMTFCTLGSGLESPIEYSADKSVIIDFKSVEGTGQYISLEKNPKGTFAKIYEHSPEIIEVLREISVPGGYMIVPLKDRFAVFSTNRVFLFRRNEEVEIYKVSKGRVGSLDLALDEGNGECRCSDTLEEKMFTCYTSYCDEKCLLTLIVDEDGELFNLNTTYGLKMEHVGKINPSKDIAIHSSGLLVSIGYNSDNCIYYIERKEGKISLKLVAMIETIRRFNTSTMVFDGVYHTYVSDGKYIGEIVEKTPISFRSELNLFENGKEKIVRGLFNCGAFVCAQYEDEVHCLYLEGEELTSIYKFVSDDEIIGYFRLGRIDFYMSGGLVRAYEMNGEGELDTKEYKIDYTSFSSNSHCIFLGQRNKIIKLGSEGLETIEIEFAIKEMESDERYLFILTGKRVLRVYSIDGRKFVFIQSFRFDVIFLSVFDGYLYTIGSDIYKFQIKEDGSLSLPIRMKEAGRPIGKKERLIIFDSQVMDLKYEGILNIDGWKSIFSRDMILASNEHGIKVYEYRKHKVVLVDEISKEKDCKILGKEQMYIDNNLDGFVIRRFNGSSVIEGHGEAIGFSSSEYQIVSMRRIIPGLEKPESKCFLKIYKEGSFMYDFETPYRIDITYTSRGEVYCSEENRLYCYEVGVKSLLRKFKLKFPSKISGICSDRDKLFVGTEKDSVFMVKDRRIVCRDKFPRRVVALERMNDGNLVVGDWAGNIIVMEVKDDSLISGASIFVNDMVVQFISQDKVFGICMSGKVVEIVEIGEELFEFLETIGEKITEALNRPFFQAFRRNRFINSEYIKEFSKLSEQQIKEVLEKTNVDIEKIFEVVNAI